MAEIYTVKLPEFEGPFDLLLFFIQRDELDVYDIPISKLTKDFLDYIHTLERLNIEIASEFILIASQLMQIKSKMLVPRPELDEEGEIIDPRTDLVERLVAYKKFKEIASILEQKYEQRRQRFTRGKLAEISRAKFANVDSSEHELRNLTLFKLAQTYYNLLKDKALREKEVKHTVKKYPYTIDEVKSSILQHIKVEHQTHFLDLVKQKPEKIYIIFSLLSILELLQQQELDILIGDGFNNFWLKKKESA